MAGKNSARHRDLHISTVVIDQLLWLHPEHGDIIKTWSECLPGLSWPRWHYFEKLTLGKIMGAILNGYDAHDMTVRLRG